MPTVRPERVEADGWHPQDRLVEGLPRMVGQACPGPGRRAHHERNDDIHGLRDLRKAQ